MAIRAAGFFLPPPLCAVASITTITSSFKSCFYTSASAKLYTEENALISTRELTWQSSSTRKRSFLVHGLGDAEMNIGEVEPSVALMEKASEILDQMRLTSIFLVGMKCEIKTNLGKLLADTLRYCYFDSDDLLVQAVGGETAAKSLQQSDEKSYRDSETEVLKQLSSMGRMVACAGDGAVQSSTNLAFLRYGVLIWVDVPLELVANEQSKPEAVPDSDSLPKMLDELAEQYNKLKEGYGTADAIVSLQKIATEKDYENLNSVTLEDMVMEVFMQIESLIRTKKMMEDAARPF